jgi:hypothetical protein
MVAKIIIVSGTTRIKKISFMLRLQVVVNVVNKAAKAPH